MVTKIDYNASGYQIDAEAIAVPSGSPYNVDVIHHNLKSESVEVWTDNAKEGTQLTEEAYDGSVSADGYYQVDYAGATDGDVKYCNTILFHSAQASANLFVWYKTLGDVIDATAFNAKADATDYVAKATYDANTILAANSDNTPAAVEIAEQRIVGRKTSGNITALSATEVRTILNVADGANAYTHPNHSGDVTSSGDGATTIANDAVTYAKMQNISATSRVLGRKSSGSGDVEELTGAEVMAIIGIDDTPVDDEVNQPITSNWAYEHAADTTTHGTTGNIVGTSDSQTLTNKTLTAPKFANGGFVADANGNEVLVFTTTASAVNELTITPAATGANPKIEGSGGDTNVGIDLQPKGTGAGAKVTVKNNTNYTTAQVRNCILSTGDPSGGSNGDLWFKYTA